MRIFAVSDLHADVCQDGDRTLRALAAHVNAAGRPEDVLLVGGDIAVDDAGIARCLDLFAPFRGKKGAVAGNHDVWLRGKSHPDSLARHGRVQEIFRSRGFVPLEEEPLIVGDTGFVGAMGWYDGSFKDPRLGIDDRAYEAKTPPWRDAPVWNDAIRAKWNASDAEVTAWQLGKLKNRLAAVQGIRDIVALVHHVPTARLLPFPHFRRLVSRDWRFANTFLGSERFAELLGRDQAVRTVINGHIHRSGRTRIGRQRYYSIGGDYDSKQLLVLEGDAHRRESFST